MGGIEIPPAIFNGWYQAFIFFNSFLSLLEFLYYIVYYSYELRWSSSDNTLKESDASGSFLLLSALAGKLCNPTRG